MRWAQVLADEQMAPFSNFPWTTPPYGVSSSPVSALPRNPWAPPRARYLAWIGDRTTRSSSCSSANCCRRLGGTAAFRRHLLPNDLWKANMGNSFAGFGDVHSLRGDPGWLALGQATHTSDL